MATATQLIEETLDLFYQDHRPSLNVLTTTVDADDTTIAFDLEPRGIAQGAFIELELEIAYVVSVTGQAATVLRAQRGTTGAAHTAGTIITVNPKLTRHRVFASLNEELYALHSAGLYQMRTVELTYNSSIQGYDLTGVTDASAMYSVSYDTPGPDESWPEIAPSQYRLVRNAETDDFASGLAIVLYHGGHPGRQLRIKYRAPFTQFASEATTTTTAGVPDSAVDILPLGVILRVGSQREWSRNFTSSQGDTRRSTEVPMGAQIASARISLAYYQQRLVDEINLLAQKYPEMYR